METTTTNTIEAQLRRRIAATGLVEADLVSDGATLAEVGDALRWLAWPSRSWRPGKAALAAARLIAACERRDRGEVARWGGRLPLGAIAPGETTVVVHPGDPYTRARTWVGTPEALVRRAQSERYRRLGELSLRESQIPTPAATLAEEWEAHERRLGAARRSHSFEI